MWKTFLETLDQVVAFFVYDLLPKLTMNDSEEKTLQSFALWYSAYLLAVGMLTPVFLLAILLVKGPWAFILTVLAFGAVTVGVLAAVSLYHADRNF